jgi:hypothetical protein
MQHTCNLFDQVDFAKPKIWLQKCSIITEHLTIFFFARGFAPRTYHSVQDLQLGEIPTEADLNRGDKSLHLFSSIAHESCRFFLVSCGAHHYVAVQQRRRPGSF